MANLIESIMAALPSDLASTTASQTGETPSAVGGALGGVVPTLLAGLLAKFQSGEGGGLLSSLTGGTGAAGGLASSLFGGSLPAVVSALASKFGVGGSTISGLFDSVSPSIGSVLTSRLGGDPTPSGALSLLEGERSSIMSALPGGLSTVLGGLGLGGLAAGAASAVSGVTDRIMPTTSPTATTTTTTTHGAREVHVEPETGGGIGKWLPWLLGALALIALIWALKSCNKEPVVTNTTTTVENTVTAVEPTPTASPTAVAIPEGDAVRAGERDGKPMVTVYFATASNTVASDFAQAAAAVKTYYDAHQGTRLAVSGFADPRGNAASNAALSKRRAEAVRASLVAAGIPATAIDLVKPSNTEDTAQADLSAARRVEVTIK